VWKQASARIAANPDPATANAVWQGVDRSIRHAGRRTAVIVDVDGTLCDVSSVRHHVRPELGVEKDFDAFHRASRTCPPNEQAIEFCRRHHAAGHVVVVVTARMDRHHDVTRDWLNQWMPVPFDGPFMREDGLRYSDVVIKRWIHRYLARSYDIVAACDDNPAIVGLWQELGIPVEVVPGWQE
jgi:phosphoglycolate phosphatase-like HAD superfamily hydrolase